MQPVGDMLARYPQSRAVFHQADVVDIGRLGAADALIDPAHDVTEYALDVVVEFLANGVRREVRGRKRRRQQIARAGWRARLQRRLPGKHIHVMVVQGVQGRRCRRGDPCGVGPGHGMSDLLGDHVGHAVRRSPNALADLRPAGQTAGKIHIDIVVLMGIDSCGVAHFALADDRTSLEGGMNFVAGAIQEAGIDEDDAFARGMDAVGAVEAGAPFLVHDPDLDRVAGEAGHVLHAREDVAGIGYFPRAKGPASTQPRR